MFTSEGKFSVNVFSSKAFLFENNRRLLRDVLLHSQQVSSLVTIKKSLVSTCFIFLCLLACALKSSSTFSYKCWELAYSIKRRSQNCAFLTAYTFSCLALEDNKLKAEPPPETTKMILKQICLPKFFSTGTEMAYAQKEFLRKIRLNFCSSWLRGTYDAQKGK